MRRTMALEVDINVDNHNDLYDDLYDDVKLSPRPTTTTIYSADLNSKSLASTSELPPPPPSTLPPAQSPKPSLILLFSCLSRRHVLCLLIPAICSSVIAGGIAPFMTYVIGQAFDAFAKFPLGPDPPQSAKDSLLHSVGLAALELIGLAVGSFALGSVTSSLWIWTAERNVMALRKAVYRSVTKRDMVWFDTHMGEQDAGGLMAKFTRETDDVRLATSLTSGYLVQYLTTTVTCLLLAFIRSWSLTLIILSAIPIFILIQLFSQTIATPLVFHERTQISKTATLLDRALSAVPTVKAFNAQFHESFRAQRAFDELRNAARSLNKVWGVTSAATHFSMMAMFVQGFWFGSKLMREGKVSPGDVMATFWACLIATSNLQMCIPHLIVLAKGKFAAAALAEMTMANHSSLCPSPTSAKPKRLSNSLSPFSKRFPISPRPLKKIIPQRCYGEFSLHNVAFAYPSKPTLTVLSDISMYFPAHETTFIVGTSGSGKSTIAGLLMRMYEPTTGHIMLDDQDVRFLDEDWLRGHIAGVSQGFGGVVVIEGKNLWENVAIGATGRPDGSSYQVSNVEVEEACHMALVHEFAKELPEGYHTVLGSSASQGVALSGGQKQRLALARARIRDPTVLILDEATSALDATSRILVFEAIKRWRKNKTTIVITHDLSQIQPDDFVYVLKNGRVAEQGYRNDLERVPDEMVDEDTDAGEFKKMMESQRLTGNHLFEKEAEAMSQKEAMLGAIQEDQAGELEAELNLSIIRPLSFSNWSFGSLVNVDMLSDNPASHIEGDVVPRRPMSAIMTPVNATFSVNVSTPRLSTRRHSFPPPPPYSPTRSTFSQQEILTIAKHFGEGAEEQEEMAFAEQKAVVRDAGHIAAANRERRRQLREKLAVHIPSSESQSPHENPAREEQLPQFWRLLRRLWPVIPQKPLLVFGLLICLLSGSMTPIFSFLLSRLLYEVSIGSQNTRIINIFGGVVLCVAALDGVLIGLKYFIMEVVGMALTTHLRNNAYTRVLKQDKTWFDSPTHAPARLIQVIVKDGEDARTFISTVIGQCLVVIAMLSVGFLWAIIRGWELTLVGLGVAPVFAGVMSIQSRLVGRCEVRNKRAREEVSKSWYDALQNIRGIRAMGIDAPFLDAFDSAAEAALETGVRGGWVEGCTYGVASGLIYLAEAVLFYVGAVLIARGRYSYLQMVEVLNLVVFTVTIASQLMAFTQKIAKSTQATHDLMALADLSTDNTSESRGLLKPINDILASGPIKFEDISFAYPARPNNLALKNFNFSVYPGECVALVGASGSGKSTVTTLLQRLYEPLEGRIRFGEVDIAEIEVGWLREQMGVVSQAAELFEDATVEENILYGIDTKTVFFSEEEKDHAVHRAAQMASLDDFIATLPLGYKSPLGEVSGGQKQRLQIARALVRKKAEVLILDECTSALDPENQRRVMEAISNVRNAKSRRRVVVVTHKMEIMRMCDRVVVMKDGEVVDEGTYEELLNKKGGVFRELARGGEWESN